MSDCICHRVGEGHFSAVHELQSENARLRAALELVANPNKVAKKIPAKNYDGFALVEALKKVAQSALGQEVKK